MLLIWRSTCVSQLFVWTKKKPTLISPLKSVSFLFLNFLFSLTPHFKRPPLRPHRWWRCRHESPSLLSLWRYRQHLISHGKYRRTKQNSNNWRHARTSPEIRLQIILPRKNPCQRQRRVGHLLPRFWARSARIQNTGRIKVQRGTSKELKVNV